MEKELFPPWDHSMFDRHNIGSHTTKIERGLKQKNKAKQTNGYSAPFV